MTLDERERVVDERRSPEREIPARYLSRKGNSNGR